ncbi:MAG: hypothetical protein ACXQTD_07880 [Candidatus Syntropharchaeia archaeon]
MIIMAKKRFAIARLAVDETILKYNGKRYYLGAALRREEQDHPPEGLSCEECSDSLLLLLNS